MSPISLRRFRIHHARRSDASVVCSFGLCERHVHRRHLCNRYDSNICKQMQLFLLVLLLLFTYFGIAVPNQSNSLFFHTLCCRSALPVNHFVRKSVPIRHTFQRRVAIRYQFATLVANRYRFDKTVDDGSPTLREVIPKSARVIWPCHSFQFFAIISF